MTVERAVHHVFVIMPFVEGGTRSEIQLTAFFENNIKRSIEGADLRDKYQVHRSGQSFDINAEIIRDLCRADIVIADLSGSDPNPNVMYELGVRLAISERPVILIREQQTDNRRIFDIYGFYTHPYDPYDYRQLERHLIDKLRRWEAGDEPYQNPVRNIIKAEMAGLTPDLTDIPADQQRDFALRGIEAVSRSIEQAYGLYGIGLAEESRGGEVTLQKRGVDIARSIHSANPFEEGGIRLVSGASAAVARRFGDGSKLPVVLANTLIAGCLEATKDGVARRDLLEGLETAMQVTVKELGNLALTAPEHVRGAVDTASKGALDVDILDALSAAGPNGIVSIEETDQGATRVETVDHMTFGRGAIHPQFFALCPDQRCVFDNCALILYTRKISSMHDLLPTLEEVARTAQPLLLVAEDIEGEALATLLVNVDRKKLRCVGVKAPGSGQGRIDRLHDLAILTGATVVDPDLGFRLENVRTEHFGHADRVIIGAQTTEVIGGRGTADSVEERVGALRRAMKDASPHDAALLSERIARLAGAVITIHLGARTAQELRDKKYRAVSALNTATAAAAGGCIPGAGRALDFVARALDSVRVDNPSQNKALEIMSVALRRPQLALLEAAETAPEPIIEQLRAAADPHLGFNARNGKIENLVISGILDAIDIVVPALEEAHSTARAFLETATWQMRTDDGERPQTRPLF
jgi:chaperonin GroEL